MTEWPIDAIVIGTRHRTDMGELDALAASIRAVGLLHPVVISKSGLLLAGRRRLEACRLLGRATIPVTVVELPNDEGSIQ